MKELAPSWDLLNKFRQELITEEDYVRIYNEQLSKLNAKVIYSRLMQMTGGKEPILMCHCGKEYFCHRHLVAEWFKKELGISVTEYNCKMQLCEVATIFRPVCYNLWICIINMDTKSN